MVGVALAGGEGGRDGDGEMVGGGGGEGMVLWIERKKEEGGGGGKRCVSYPFNSSPLLLLLLHSRDPPNQPAHSASRKEPRKFPPKHIHIHSSSGMGKKICGQVVRGAGGCFARTRCYGDKEKRD